MDGNQDREFKSNILVVDDTLDNINLLSTMLTERGYKVRKALSGAMALMGVQAAPPDLILLDINMPEMNGYEVCQKLKADEKSCDIPVIFLSALDDVIDKVKAFKVGGTDYITKPFQFEEVLSRVENQLTIRRLQKQLQEQNALLQESEAKERDKSQQLELALQQLQQTQAQLIQSEKMSSLGHLVAGIAHEINNPVSFIYGNLTPFTEYTNRLLNLLNLYQAYCAEPPEKIQEALEELEIEYIQEDLTKVIGSMKSGADRLAEIVKALRNFSRHDEAELKSVDLHEGLESTLMLLQHRLNNEVGQSLIHIDRNYGKLPLVGCYAGQINQVFMNILVNAIEALERKNEKNDTLTNSTIAICTQLLPNDRVRISIRDNGLGIPPEVQPHLFDPFFTTKAVGQGKGLGLSISYAIIVDLHGGELRCLSHPGQGTEIAIEIPVKAVPKGVA